MTYTYNIMFTIAASVVVILLAFIVTKLIASRYSNLNQTSGNIRVIERLNLGVDKQLAIVAIKEQYYLVAITKMGIELIDKLDGMDFDIQCIETKSIDFNDILKNFRNKNR